MMPNVQGVSHFHLLHCHLTPELSPSPAVHAGPTTVSPGPGHWAPAWSPSLPWSCSRHSLQEPGDPVRLRVEPSLLCSTLEAPVSWGHSPRSQRPWTPRSHIIASKHRAARGSFKNTTLIYFSDLLCHFSSSPEFLMQPPRSREGWLCPPLIPLFKMVQSRLSFFCYPNIRTLAHIVPSVWSILTRGLERKTAQGAWALWNTPHRFAGEAGSWTG